MSRFAQREAEKMCPHCGSYTLPGQVCTGCGYLVPRRAASWRTNPKLREPRIEQALQVCTEVEEAVDSLYKLVPECSGDISETLDSLAYLRRIIKTLERQKR